MAMIERVLVVGLGSIGKRHLCIVREELPNADIQVLRHQACDGVPEFCNGCFSKSEEALSYKPQVAIIANPAPFHLDIALPLAKIGCHLLVEKPLSDSLSKVDQLLQIVESNQLILQVGYNLRYLSSLSVFREYIASGNIGKVLSVHCVVGQYLPDWRFGKDYRDVVSARKELGGGALLELSHEIDYLRWIFGGVAWVNAWVGKQSSLDINVEDTAHLILGVTPDSTGHSTVIVLAIDFVRRDTTRSCNTIGETGSIRWNGLTGEVDTYMARDGWRNVYSYAYQRDDSYRAQLKAFVDSVESGAPPLVSGEDGLAVLNIIDAIRKSASLEGARVYVNQVNEMLE